MDDPWSSSPWGAIQPSSSSADTAPSNALPTWDSPSRAAKDDDGWGASSSSGGGAGWNDSTNLDGGWGDSVELHVDQVGEGFAEIEVDEQANEEEEREERADEPEEEEEAGEEEDVDLTSGRQSALQSSPDVSQLALGDDEVVLGAPVDELGRDGDELEEGSSPSPVEPSSLNDAFDMPRTSVSPAFHLITYTANIYFSSTDVIPSLLTAPAHAPPASLGLVRLLPELPTSDDRLPELTLVRRRRLWRLLVSADGRGPRRRRPLGTWSRGR